MTPLDEALATFRDNMNDHEKRGAFYDLFLNTTFHLPIVDETLVDVEPAPEEGMVMPLVVEAEGKDYLVIFDSTERLFAWAGSEIKYAAVPGHVLAATSPAPLFWALNVGTDYSKEFLPEEIAWLKEAVERCETEAAKAESKSSLIL